MSICAEAGLLPDVFTQLDIKDYMTSNLNTSLTILLSFHHALGMRLYNYSFLVVWHPSNTYFRFPYLRLQLYQYFWVYVSHIYMSSANIFILA